MQNKNTNKPGLVAEFGTIENYLESEVDRLSSSTAFAMDEDVAEESQKFSSDTFFSNIDAFYRDKSQGLTVTTLADTLDLYIPRIFDAMDDAGDKDFEKVKLYKKWIDYLHDKALSQKRIAAVTLTHGQKILERENYLSHQYTAFNTLYYLTDTLMNTVMKHPEEVDRPTKENLCDLITGEAPQALEGCSQLGEKGLETEESQIFWHNNINAERIGSYFSYSQSARIVYGKCVTVLQDIGTPEQVNNFIEDAYPRLAASILECETGFRIVKGPETIEEYRIPDTNNAFQCFDIGLAHFKKNSDAFGVGRYVFNYGLDLLEGLLEKQDYSKHASAFKSMQDALKGTAYLHGFSVLAGGRDAAYLLKQKRMHEATALLVQTKNALSNPVDDALILCDLGVTPHRPVAVVFKMHHTHTQLPGSVAVVLDDRHAYKIQENLEGAQHLADVAISEKDMRSAYKTKNKMPLVHPDQRRDIRTQAWCITRKMRTGTWQENAELLSSKDSPRLYSCPVDRLFAAR